MSTSLNDTQVVFPDNNTLSSTAAESIVVSGSTTKEKIGFSSWNLTSRATTTSTTAWTTVDTVSYTRVKSNSTIIVEILLNLGVALQSSNSTNYGGAIGRVQFTNGATVNASSTVQGWLRSDVYGGTKEEEYTRPIIYTDTGSGFFGVGGSVTSLSTQVMSTSGSATFVAGMNIWSSPCVIKITEFF